jgi:Mrp family chromosome partitioning ATPase/capsular polysaccharide biosynthesis protein
MDRRPRLLADAFRRRWIVVLVVAAIGGLAGIGFKLLRTTTYDGTTSVLIYAVAGNPFDKSSQNNLLVDMSTEAQLVRSDPVAKLAAPILTGLGYDNVTVGGLLSRVRAEVEPNTQVLHIMYSARAAARARDGADAFAKAYLKHREDQAKADAKVAVAQIAVDRKRIQGIIADTSARLGQTDPTSLNYEPLRTQLRTQNQALNDLARVEADLTKRKTLPGVVLSPAALPQAPHGVSAAMLGLLGLFVGLVGGLIIAVGLERAAGRIRRPDAVPSDLEVLAVVHPSHIAQPVLLTRPEHSSAEPYRLLRLAIDAALPTEPGQSNVLVVTCLTDPAPPVAANLALAAAEAGHATTLVDALPKSSAPRLPGLSTPADATGLSEVVLEGLDPIAARLHVAPRLTLLTTGRSLQRAVEAYAGPRMRGIVDRLRRGCDLLIIAAPPLSNPDGQALASLADAVIVVIPLGTGTLDQLDEAAAEARRVHAPILGVVAAYPGRSPRKAPTPPPAAPFDLAARERVTS